MELLGLGQAGEVLSSGYPANPANVFLPCVSEILNTFHQRNNSQSTYNYGKLLLLVER